ncbi:MAG: DNA-binding response regulator [Bacteroidetes bacterium RIFCSPLOWO2_12_FULL_31_6]|nr:MAG: DNA-binding response regulator [Bacteroidetes bacterium RIFCSPLOWO2_12_FULL_31_6]
MDKLKAIIIEDESLGRALIKNYLQDIKEIELIGEFADGFSGLKAINELHPDIVFLDIQMPKLTGLELLELLDEPPAIIFTTAFDEYAVKAFELNAIDYLLKPFSKERFDGAVKKIITQKNHHSPALINLKNQVAKEKVLDKIIVKSNNNVFVIPLNEVIYIESEDDYVMIYTANGKYLQYQTMSYYEEHLTTSIFIRIHRSTIVNIHFIAKIEKFGKETYQVVLKDGIGLKVSRSRYQELKEMLGF